MRSRSSLVVVFVVVFLGGLVTGVLLGRGAPALLGQTTRTAVEGREPANANAAMSRTQSDDATYDALAKQYRQFEQINRTFELVSRAVSPTVVHIVAQKTTPADENHRARQFDETGSGVIVRGRRAPGLYVLTNHHVIEGAKTSRIRILLQDGRTITPVKTWNDAMADIAVLALDRNDLPAARMGDSDDAVVGSWVLAMGSPFGLTHSVSQGIISARGRHMDELQDVENQDFLQTDAAINPGNSGGPLVNMKGEVIGINNSIASNGGGNEGVGFSIAINLARWILDELVDHGRVTRGALGVELHPHLLQEEAAALGLERPKGALVDKVHQTSPAAKAGLKDGDVILRFGGAEITDVNHLINRVSMSQVGAIAEVVVWRDRHEVVFQVTIGERERTLAQPGATPPADRAGDPSGLVRRPVHPEKTPSFALGLELATLDAELARQSHLPESWRGVLVVRVEPDSPLVQQARVGDVISSIDNQAVQSAEQAVKLLNQHDEHSQAVIRLDRLVSGKIEQRTVRVP